MTKLNELTDDFVPLASVLEDYTESSNSGKERSLKEKVPLPKCKKTCCVHGAPCILASKSSKKSSRHNDNGFTYQRSTDNTCDYYLKNSAKSPTVNEKAYDKIRHDQRSTAQYSDAVKTRWPLTELISESLMNPPMVKKENSVGGGKNLLKKAESNTSQSSFYDNIVNHGYNETDCASLGRRKFTKSIIKHTNPKLNGVLEETGYIELQVPKGSHEASNKISKKKTSVWDNLPYADVGYLTNRTLLTTSSAGKTNTSPPDVLSENEFINRATDLELVQRYYIGHKERKAAEIACKLQPDSFFLYHQVPELQCNLDNLKKSIRLFLIYVTPSLRFKHYVIQKFWMNDPSYCVEADPKRTFKSLNELIRFYALNKTVVGHNGQKQRFRGN